MMVESRSRTWCLKPGIWNFSYKDSAIVIKVSAVDGQSFCTLSRRRWRWKCVRVPAFAQQSVGWLQQKKQFFGQCCGLTSSVSLKWCLVTQGAPLRDGSLVDAEEMRSGRRARVSLADWNVVSCPDRCWGMRTSPSLSFHDAVFFSYHMLVYDMIYIYYIYIVILYMCKMVMKPGNKKSSSFLCAFHRCLPCTLEHPYQHDMSDIAFEDCS